MPLMRPMTHSGKLMLLSPDDRSKCSDCPDFWFHVSFDTEFNGGTQGFYIKLDDGSFRKVVHETAAEAILWGFPADRVFEVGRDGYYLSLADSRQAVDVDFVHGIHYVDDYNDEWQDVYVCDPALPPFNVPGRETHNAEPIR